MGKRRLKYEYELNPEARNSTAASIYRLALEGKERVLDLGSGPAIVSAHLARENGREVVCVDSDAEALEVARERGVAQAIEADLQSEKWLEELAGRQFDVVILADVLEHLVDPGHVLDAIRENHLVAENGFLVVSLPNVAHLGVLSELLDGRFDYRPTGLLDQTHLRFFTRATFIELCEGHGYFVSRLLRTTKTLEQSEFFGRLTELPVDVRKQLAESNPDIRTYQYIARVEPMEAANELAALRQTITERDEELAKARASLQRAEKELGVRVSELRRLRGDGQEIGAGGIHTLLEWKEDVRKRMQAARVELREAKTRISSLERELELQRDVAASHRLAAESELARRDYQIRDLKDHLERARKRPGLRAKRALKKARRSVDRARVFAEELRSRVGVGRGSTADAGSGDTAAASDAVAAQVDMPAGEPSSPASEALTSDRLELRVEEDVDARAAYEDALGRRAFETERTHLCIAVYTTDLEEGRGDVYVALGLGSYLEPLGYEVVYVPRERWAELPENTDLLLAMLPSVDISAAPERCRTIGWVRNETENWCAAPWLRLYDALLCSSEESRQRLSHEYHGDIGNLRIGFDARIFAPPADDSNRNGVVSTVNQWGRERQLYASLRQRQIRFPLALYGQTRGLNAALREYACGSASFFAMPSLYRGCCLVLDDHNHTTRDYGNINSRVYEALACGALVITNTGVGLHDIGLNEVPTYVTPAELHDKIRHYLTHPEEARDLAERLGSIVREKHSFESRAAQFHEFVSGLGESKREVRGVLAFFPDYRAANPYQSMLYSKCWERGVISVPVGDPANLFEARPKNGGAPFVAHIHWTAPILGPAKTSEEASALSHEFVEQLDAIKSSGGKLLWTVHNTLPHECAYPEAEAALRQQIADRVDRIHLLGEETSDEVKPHYLLPKEKVRVVRHSSYLGVYPNYISQERARQELGFEPKDRVLLFLGGIRPYKGVDRLLDAFETVFQEDPLLRLIVVGKPGRFPGVGEIANRCLAHPHILSNFNTIEDGELQVFFKAADAVVLPHRRALNSGALLLAYSFARPVIAPALGGMRAYLSEDAGVIYDPEDNRGLEDAIRRVAVLRERRYRDAALAIARAYQSSQMAEDFISLLEELLPGSR